jgi:hypothetical protein
MKKILLLLLLATSAGAQQKLLSPKEFLGYELGDRFTRHHRVLEYHKHVADALPNVDVVTYGETYEQRPLTITIIASPENFQNLEQIRQDNLKRTGLSTGNPSGSKVAIVWLSYNVHGNESNSLETSMWTLYELANPSNSAAQVWLKNTVVIIDPCINPDGRDRYANFYNQYGNQEANPDIDAIEHHEPWPGGRANHYWFDLNRDWAWLTQKESQERIKLYHQWMPHVHVDFHEQGYNNPYYFAPAAEPYHEVISNWQREFQTTIGKNHAKYFDAQGWLYFTKEVFDLFYPSYGDTYPTYSGAIGMTYEQAGSGRGGKAITTQTGDVLTLLDRIKHHHTAGLSTVEITSKNAGRVVDEFEKYFRDNNNSPAAPFKTYVIKGDNNPDKIKTLTQWMDAHAIRYGYAAAGKATRGYDYQTQTQANVNVSTDDIIVNIYQPKSRFITSVFEPQSKLSDTLTYDITAWNLFYAYDLKGYALTERINVGKPYEVKAPQAVANTKPYAYLFRYHHVNDARLLAALLKKNIKVSVAKKSFAVNGQRFDAGTLVVLRGNNTSFEKFDETVQSIATEQQRTVFTSATGFVDEGKDFGSSEVSFLKAPRVASLVGDQTSSLSAGEVWHYFEQVINYPITPIGTDYFGSVDLKKFDVLIVPEGYYSMFDDGMLDKISSWVSGGGRLIVIADALSAFADKKGFALKPFTTEDEKKEAEKKSTEEQKKEILARYEDSERTSVSSYISGAVYKVAIDKSHPLAFGLRDTYFSLKTSSARYGFLNDGWNVGVLKGKVKPVQGFAGYKSNKELENSLVFGVENKGRGNVVYLVDNPLFRSFWDHGKLVFANAVFMVGL